MTVDFFNMTAEAVHGRPEGWQWHTLDASDAPPGYVKVVGGVPTGVISRGPRKGSPKWGGPSDMLWMKRSDVEAIKTAWEQATGKCSSCFGSGQEVARISVSDGAEYRACSRCNGTGAAREQT